MRNLAAAFAAFLFVCCAHAADWPGGNVELVVPSGPASGLDTAMRSMKNLLDGAKLLGASSIVVNKAGAGGAIAYQYINQRPGNVRYLALASPSLITNRMMGIGDVDHRDVTAVCRLFSDNIVFMVRADSPISDGRALIARLRASPSAASFGIATAMGGANHIAAASMLKDAGIDIKAALYVGYKSGADALIALLSGDVDVVPVAAPVSLPQLAAGKVRVIAVSSPERLGGALAQVPTWREQGVDSAYTSWRVIVAPKGTSDDDVRRAADAFAKLAALPQWKAELERNYWIGNYLAPEPTRSFLAAQWTEHRQLLGQLGLAQ